MSDFETDLSTDDNYSSQPEPSWWIDDKTPGTGDRPDWLPSKFKSTKDVVNSYSELEKRLGSAPKEYDLSRIEVWDDSHKQSFKELAEYAKKKNISQDVMDKIVDTVDGYKASMTVNYEAEKEKLGKDADERLERLDVWARSNFSEQTYEALTQSLNSAEAIKAVEEIRAKMINDNVYVPNGNDSSLSGSATLEDIQAELTENLEKYKSDPKYRRDLMQRMEAVSHNGPYSDKSY